MDKALTDLIKISKTVGNDPSLVIGGFGNTSVKTTDGKFMYIKASGTALKNMNCRCGWRKLRLDKLQTIMQDKSFALLSSQEKQQKMSGLLRKACSNNISSKIKPSIESCFHAILDRYVIHLHPTSVFPFLCVKGGKSRIQQIFKNQKRPPLWIPYASPGYSLAKKIQKLNSGYKKQHCQTAAVIFLQNHGIIITAKSSAAVIKLLQKTINTCSGKLNRIKTESAHCSYVIPNAKTISKAALVIQQVLFNATGEKNTINHFLDEKIAGFMAQKNASRLCSIPAVSFDELFYSHGPAMWLELSAPETVLGQLNKKITKYQPPPTAFLIKPLGLFIIGHKKQAIFIKDIVTTYFSIRTLAAKLGTLKPFTQSQRSLLLALQG